MPRRSRYGELRDRAVVEVLTQPTMEDAARALGIGLATLKRWRERDDFAAALKAATDRIASKAADDLDRYIEKVDRLGDEALDVLAQTMRDAQRYTKLGPDIDWATRAAAASQLARYKADLARLQWEKREDDRWLEEQRRAASDAGATNG